MFFICIPLIITLIRLHSCTNYSAKNRRSFFYIQEIHYTSQEPRKVTTALFSTNFNRRCAAAVCTGLSSGGTRVSTHFCGLVFQE